MGAAQALRISLGPPAPVCCGAEAAGVAVPVGIMVAEVGVLVALAVGVPDAVAVAVASGLADGLAVASNVTVTEAIIAVWVALGL